MSRSSSTMRMWSEVLGVMAGEALAARRRSRNVAFRRRAGGGRGNVVCGCTGQIHRHTEGDPAGGGRPNNPCVFQPPCIQGTLMTRIDKVLYTGKTRTSSGGRDGEARSSDGRLDIKLSSPGSAGAGTN
eukprot:Opistho-1_new@100303